jgi:hypothetical protein
MLRNGPQSQRRESPGETRRLPAAHGRTSCRNVHTGIAHRAYTIPEIASDCAGRDFGLGIPVHDHAMAGVVLNDIREDLRGGASVDLDALQSVVLNGVRRADPVVGRAKPSDAAIVFDRSRENSDIVLIELSKQ